MRTRSLLRHQLILLGGATLIFFLIGLFASITMTQIDRTRFQNSPTLFLARMMDALEDQYHLSHEQTMDLIKHSNEGHNFPIEAKALTRDEAIALLHPGESLPARPYDMVDYGPQDAWHFPSRMIRLASAGQEQYLSVIYQPRATPMHRIFNLQTAVMMTSIFLAALFSLLYLFWYMRKQARLAARVIASLREGDLSARFPVSKMDEIGLLMVEFNNMADEIQTLVETIRHSELGRMRRLQELAHDLRTPVASLKNLLETLLNHYAGMTIESKVECVNLALKEVDYFQRLVEDVLFLAQVRDPKYAVVKTPVALVDLLDEELETVKSSYPKIEYDLQTNGSATVGGDGHLLRRLFRNALENAFSFAKAKVEVRLSQSDGKVRILITDDGPGFNNSTLTSFGEKRGTRIVSPNPEARLSVGLGSVIMKEVVKVHCGKLLVRNQPGLGAQVEIILCEDNKILAKEESHLKLSSQP